MELSQNSPTPESPPLEEHRAKVSSLAKETFAKFDSRIAAAIGFQGNIWQTIFEQRPKHQNDGINVDNIPPGLARYISGSALSINLTDTNTQNRVSYHIECFNGSFVPEIKLATGNHEVSFKLLLGPNHDNFSQIVIDRPYLNDQHRFVGSKTIETFVNDSHGQNNPLVIAQRTNSQTSLKLLYDHIDKDGNLDLSDQQPVLILPNNNHSHGIYLSKDGAILWKWPDRYTQPTVSTSPDQATMIIDSQGGQFRFPFRTNLYTELQDILTMVQNLPRLS